MFHSRDNGLNWVQQQKITASNGAANNQFGISVVLWNKTMVIGAMRRDDDKGTVYGYLSET